MRYLLSRVWGAVVGVPVAVIAFFTSAILDFTFLIDFVIGIAGFVVGYVPTQRLTSRAYLKEMNLTRKDYHYIMHQINLVQNKNKRFLKSFIKVRSIQDFKLVNDIYRLSRTINSAIKQRPFQFFNIESFYYSHIDNALNLIESYTRLAKMPLKADNERQMLQQTRITLEEVKRTLIADLKQVNAQDYEQLDTEMRLNEMYQRRHVKEMENDS
ncbi:5-bromo-4-chloroindolyl phosphate hydrolysis family protein [Staphylococcus pseudintermedius]|uniref:5-bromo-4-chloroindolyl phosphate hydrolysis family protein n=1 Tax=Staphylococcus pseudintermedius TaxID=283734 RepID=UPI0019E0ADEC|nr:5-bromo-4-chloroindolyl phosphate hydrolysis family protein [Staphylococcus pseudintermedius]EGQ3138126.1 5-bromo-4-chloroindolyl phosphate hydrolase [Staphylococcus pseudintermedius]EGQ3139483.1 5-bromo-4-chloroindolyl phosphate hydrolase [Staphylococcus pseudintermedius]EHL7207423.1 5-bromo-4-chloroindolyl phosphate hydrolysis family protein [Staphylococcus pseudintermedius]EHT1791893.1 5-bromo-4-chloroindolyl phosphate hydrolysis family protein [Staphylococcus pseudintermedius]EIM5206164